MYYSPWVNLVHNPDTGLWVWGNTGVEMPTGTKLWYPGEPGAGDEYGVLQLSDGLMLSTNRGGHGRSVLCLFRGW